MKLSIVSTLYKSEPFLDQFIEILIKSIQYIEIQEFEIIFVNDGSPDNSIKVLRKKQQEIKEIVILDLSRNFGHHHAILAGLSHANGEHVFLIDNDLEVSPDFLEVCYYEMRKDKNLDVVYGVQRERKGKSIEKLGGQLFWWAINKVSEVEIPKNIVTERLMTKKYVTHLLELGDANLFLAGMMHWVGFNQKGIFVEKKLRDGESTYSTKKRLELMSHAITSFSGKPLHYLFNIGVTITGVSILFIFYFAAKKIFYGSSVQMGWTSIIMINILILGIISTALGLIGIYLFKMFRQVQNRPRFIIKDIYKII